MNDCAVCHAEHQGRDADLRPFDTDDFDHVEETGFGLEGYHGEFAGDCANCHTTRSFLNLTTDCTTCHTDVHKTTLGDDCTACHSVDSHFKNASTGIPQVESAAPSKAATWTFPVPHATGTESRRGRRRAATTATGSADRMTPFGPDSESSVKPATNR